MPTTKIFVIIGAIVAASVIIGVSFSTLSKDNVSELDNESTEVEPKDDIDMEIEKKLEEIEREAAEYEYEPAERDWPTSGPFQIDRSQYVIGENVFLRIEGLEPNEKGQIAFLRPLNATHYDVYITIPFDGSNKNIFNQYFKPSLSKQLGICTTDDLVGRWAVVFRGTNYENIYFEIVNKILPGEEDSYQPLC